MSGCPGPSSSSETFRRLATTSGRPCTSRRVLRAKSGVNTGTSTGRSDGRRGLQYILKAYDDDYDVGIGLRSSVVRSCRSRPSRRIIRPRLCRYRRSSAARTVLITIYITSCTHDDAKPPPPPDFGLSPPQ